MERPWWVPDLPTIVVWMVLMTFAFVIVLLMTRPMPMTEQAGTLLTTLIGLLAGSVATIVNFFFGSATTNKDKDATIKAQTEALAKVSVAATNGKTGDR